MTSADARLALRQSVELEEYPETSVPFYACDADFDRNVTSADARIILRMCVSMERLDDENATLAADVDFDGSVTAEDARWILRTSVGYDTGASTLAGLAAGK